MVDELQPTLKNPEDTIIVNLPSIKPLDQSSTPVADDADEDSSDEPIIVINWDALGDSLGNLRESLKVKIELNPADIQ